MRIARLVLICAFAVTIVAQAAELRGVVEDTDGLPVPRATVMLGGSANSVQTDDSGHFVITHLNEGDVVLQIHADGFKDKKMDVKVAKATVAVRIALSVAPVSEELTVRASAADPVASDTNLSGFQIESDLLKSVPTQER